MTAPRPYSRVYHELVDDPMFASVYDNDRLFAPWVRMLMLADALWPASAPMPAKTAVVRQLIECGLVIEKPGNRYTIRGLEKERQSRSDSARNAAAKRWQSKGNADAMPRRDETSKDEQIGATAPATMMGFRPKRSAPDPSDVHRQMQEDWTATCGRCGVLKRKHPAGGDHPFEVAA